MESRETLRLPVTKIQKFCTGDGPGIRTTVFLKGCPLRCVWCHNPETQSAQQEFFYTEKFCVSCGSCCTVCPTGAHEIVDGRHTLDRGKCTRCMKCVPVCVSMALEGCSAPQTPREIYAEGMKDKAFYGKTGGVTVSGGEPMLYADGVAELFGMFRASGVHTAMETCGFFERERLQTVLPVTDLFLWDVKDTDDARHRQNTGVPFEPIRENLLAADAMGAKTVLRCIFIRGVNDDRRHLEALAGLYESLTNCRGVELLPYHTYGDSKRIQLGLPSSAHPEWIPTAEDLQSAKAFLRKYVKVI
ncbi:MAG: glycyl-radical enzyme activating protein [Oscillospiraceae bacterium]|nr:glycyl-radical enzyme activating protein [Oscillospiraceae bacterium]